MKYYVPQLTLQTALEFEKSLESIIPEDEFDFDFSKMSNFDPLPMLLVGAIMRRYRQKYEHIPFKFSGLNSTGKEYAGTMGFFKYVAPTVSRGKNPGEATGSRNYIPITRIAIDELQQAEIALGNFIPIGNILEKESNRLATIVDRGNDELHKLLTYLIREILRNTPEHAQINEMWICGQYWPKFQLAEVAILDEGVGIFNSLTKNFAHRQYITDNASAIQWALKAGISQAFRPSSRQKDNDDWANSGFGLYMVSEICKYLNGNFCIISYGNYLLINNHGIKMGETSFHGTAIRMRVPSKRIDSAKNIITTILQQGELEARNIRNAFKTASTPSRGLMENLNIKSS